MKMLLMCGVEKEAFTEFGPAVTSTCSYTKALAANIQTPPR